jgi:hypothetical protein
MAKVNASACEKIADSMAANGWLIAIRVHVGSEIPWVICATRGDGLHYIVHSDDIVAAFAELSRIAQKSAKQQ